MPGRVGRVQFIVVHHPGSDNISLTLKDHVHPPYVAPPYDFFFEYPSGLMVVGRSLAMRGAHVIPDYTDWRMVNNDTAIGVAAEGNFDNDTPPIGPSEAQIELMARQVGFLCAEHSIWPHDGWRDPKKVLEAKQGFLPHRRVTQTACPGRHFMAIWEVFAGKVKWYSQRAREGEGERT